MAPQAPPHPGPRPYQAPAADPIGGGYPRPPASPRAAFTCGTEPQGGPASPSCHARRRGAARADSAELRKRHGRPPPALPEREAGRPGRGREARRGRGRPASATLPGPLRPPPLSMRGTTAPARNWDACAVAPSKPLIRGPFRGPWEPSVGALSCGGGVLRWCAWGSGAFPGS